MLDITWLADANFARTSGRDADGLMDWPTATAWVRDLEYYGLTGWRLPTAAPLNGLDYVHDFSNNGTTDVGFGSRGTLSELAHLYYVTLGNKGSKSAKLYLATSATASPLAVSLYGTGLTPP